MSLQRSAMRLGMLALVGLSAFLLWFLVRWADVAYATQRHATETAPPPSAGAWAQTYYFERAAAPKALLVAGWSDPEPAAGVWSRQRRAVLRLPPTPLAGPAEVALTVEPYLAKARPFQRVVARAGDRKLGEWRLTKPGTTALSFAVPAELRIPAPLEVQLDLPDADSPAKVEGAMDARLLGIRLHRIDVTG